MADTAKSDQFDSRCDTANHKNHNSPEVTIMTNPPIMGGPQQPYDPQRPPAQHVVPPAAPQRRRRYNTALWLLLAAATFFIGLCSGIGIDSAANSHKTPAVSTQKTYFPDCPFAAGGCPSSGKAAAVAAPSPTPSPTPSKSPVPPPPPPPPTISEGTWTVGVDFPPGTYRVTADVADCYWEIDKSGTNGNEIIANDNATGGRPTVTLKVGQDFTTHRCGTWQKVG